MAQQYLRFASIVRISAGATVSLSLMYVSGCKTRHYHSQSYDNSDSACAEASVSRIVSSKGTKLFHWTNDRRAVDDPWVYLKSKSNPETHKTNLENFCEAVLEYKKDPDSNFNLINAVNFSGQNAGSGLYTAGDPIISSGYGKYLLALETREGLEFSYSKTLDMMSPLGSLERATAILSKSPGLVFHWFPGISTSRAVVLRDTKTLLGDEVLASAIGFDFTSEFKTFSEIGSQEQAKIKDWKGFLKEFSRFRNILWKIPVQSDKYFDKNTDVVTEEGAWQAIQAEWLSPNPKFDLKIESFVKSENGPKTCDSITNCKSELISALDKKSTKTPLRTEVQLLVDSGYLGMWITPDSYSNLREFLVSFWRQNGGEKGFLTMTKGLDFVEKEFKSQNVGFWKEAETPP
jgi:hypothetical protein